MNKFSYENWCINKLQKSIGVKERKSERKVERRSHFTERDDAKKILSTMFMKFFIQQVVVSASLQK